MSDQRFYELKNYTCPQCNARLVWLRYNRADRRDSLRLFHETGHRCPNDGKSFYAPVVVLTEIPQEMI